MSQILLLMPLEFSRSMNVFPHDFRAFLIPAFGVAAVGWLREIPATDVWMTLCYALELIECRRWNCLPLRFAALPPHDRMRH
jgi:hypothetical protein